MVVAGSRSDSRFQSMSRILLGLEKACLKGLPCLLESHLDELELEQEQVRE